MTSYGKSRDISGIVSAQKDIKEIENFISKFGDHDHITDLSLSRCLNETWFSDTLAWLLDPKGSHQLGRLFVEKFVQAVGKIRSKGGDHYAHRKSHLKWGKSGSGRGSTNFSFKNAAVFREYYLTKEIKKRNGRGPRYCDIVFMDLDSKDSIFLVIENKFFTANHPFQLEEYFEAVEQKYGRAQIREYVYLTVRGKKPIDFGNNDSRILKHWVRVSWVQHVLGILKTLGRDKKSDDVDKLIELLQWLKDMLDPPNNTKNSIENVIEFLVTAAAECLHDELNRLGEGKRGGWKIKRGKEKSTQLVHSSVYAPVYVELLPNGSITVQGRGKNFALYEKVLVPYGSHPDQIFNLLDMAARDIYHFHFNDPAIYLGNRRRQRVTRSETKQKYLEVFDFIHRHRHQLQVLFMLSSRIWKAEQDAIKMEYENRIGNIVDYVE